MASRFQRGSGIDLWFDCGQLSEEREFARGLLHGVERWWATKTTVWHETHWRNGLKHGVEREWNEKGQLRRGFPRFFVRDEQVTRHRYEAARSSDPTLMPRRITDDAPKRSRVGRSGSVIMQQSKSRQSGSKE